MQQGSFEVERIGDHVAVEFPDTEAFDDEILAGVEEPGSGFEGGSSGDDDSESDALYDEAVQQSKKTLQMDPNFAIGHYELGQAFEQKHMHDQAIAEFQKARGLVENSMEMLAALGQGYAWCGPSEDAKRVLISVAQTLKACHPDSA